MLTIPRDVNLVEFLLVIQQNSTTLSNTGTLRKTTGIQNSSLLVPTFLNVVPISTLHQYIVFISTISPSPK